MKTVTINKMKVKIFEEDELREKLKIEKEDIDIILKYQRIFPELLQSDVNDFCINARNLHNNLVNGAKGIKMINGKEKIIKGTRFNDWINKRIKKYNFIENKDFKSVLFFEYGRFTEEEVNNMSEQKRSSYGITKEYKLTLDMAKQLCMIENNELGNVCRRYFIVMEKALRDYEDWINTRNPEIENANILKSKLKEWANKNLECYDLSGVQAREFNMINYNLLGCKAFGYKTKVRVFR